MKRFLATVLAVLIAGAAVAQQRTPTPNIPLNDAMGQFWSLKTVDDGLGNQVIVTTPSATSAGGVTPTDCSATIATGGTAQQLIATSATRKGYSVQNVSTGNIGISFTSATPVIGGAQTFTLAPGASVAPNTSGTESTALFVIGATTGQQIACERW